MSELTIYAPINVGELFDKITILQIKLEQFTDKRKVLLVIKELDELLKLAKTVQADVSQDVTKLKEVNLIIWNNEDIARTYPAENLTDEQLMSLAKVARSTYEANTMRAQIKREINRKTNSFIVETKSYIEEN